MTKFCKQNCMEYGRQMTKFYKQNSMEYRWDRMEKYDVDIFSEMSGIHSITTTHTIS